MPSPGRPCDRAPLRCISAQASGSKEASFEHRPAQPATGRRRRERVRRPDVTLPVSCVSSATWTMFYSDPAMYWAMA